MNKVVVVTGASRGIGKAIVLTFAKKGYDVVINYLDNEKENAIQVQNECHSLGVQALIVEGNVVHYEDMERLINESVKTFGHVDVLVNNAGITKDQLLLKMDTTSFMNVIDVNLKGTFNTIKAVSRTMMKQKSGTIINMASVVGISGNAGQANYAASKAGVIGLTKSIAKELASRNIRVNAIAPGFIATKMTDVLNETTKENILQNIPLRKLGDVQDVANAVYFLASEEAKYITGQVLHVDGGMLM